MGRCASGNHEIRGNGFLQASSKTNEPTQSMGRRETRQEVTSNSHHIGRQYDPISGRMVPSACPEFKGANSAARNKGNCSQDDMIGAKTTASPMLGEGRHHQVETSKLNNKSPSGSQSSVACSPGNELEALLRSRTSTTVGQTSDTRVQCPPGNELEAKFIADPTSCSDQSLPSELNSQQSNGSFPHTMDCPPGNELEVKLTTELGGLGIKPADPVQTKTGSKSPASDFKAQAWSDPAGRQPIDCSPGFEVEANLISNPDSAEYGQFQPPMIKNADTSKKANFNIDCSPGSELEAFFIADSASSKGPTSLGSGKKRANSRSLGSDASEDRVGDFIIQNQTPAPENKAQAPEPQRSFSEFRILSFDASISQVSSANADLFFGAQEDVRTSDILSRLHTPAKFLPYLEMMQRDGYEIATGGGDILVFRKINDAHLPSKTGKQNPAIHAEIAKHLRHDSIDPPPSHQRDSRISTTEVSRQ